MFLKRPCLHSVQFCFVFVIVGGALCYIFSLLAFIVRVGEFCLSRSPTRTQAYGGSQTPCEVRKLSLLAGQQICAQGLMKVRRKTQNNKIVFLEAIAGCLQTFQLTFNCFHALRAFIASGLTLPVNFCYDTAFDSSYKGWDDMCK